MSCFKSPSSSACSDMEFETALTIIRLVKTPWTDWDTNRVMEDIKTIRDTNTIRDRFADWDMQTGIQEQLHF